MPTVTIKSIGRQKLLSNNDYAWLIERLNTALPLMSISYNPRDGKVWTFSIWYDTPEDTYTTITLFVDYNQVEMEVNYNDSNHQVH